MNVATTVTCCQVCGGSLPTPGSEVSPRKYCSNACINAIRRARYVPAAPDSIGPRLWSRLEKLPSGCWEWRGARNPDGYGRISHNRRRLQTHRVAWELTNGPIPEGLMIRHKCDNPPCCNPDHLESGTAADNSKDAVERGRTARGFRMPHTRLSDEHVDEIRKSYQRAMAFGRRGWLSKSAELADQYGVSRKYVDSIAKGRERPYAGTAIAADWAATHDGGAIKDTSDIGGLEILLSDLRAKA